MSEIDGLVDAWLDDLLSSEPALKFVGPELADHLLCASEFLMESQNLSAGEAFQQALLELGSPTDVRNELHLVKGLRFVPAALLIALSAACAAAMFFVDDITWLVVGWAGLVYVPYNLYVANQRRTCLNRRSS